MDYELQLLTENVGMPLLDSDLLKSWLMRVAQVHERIPGLLTYIFCDDKRIIEVNREFLSHDYYTDIITFDYSKRRIVSGDMFISLDTVLSNAESLSVDYSTELHRVIAHGLLHLCGINDKGPGERAVMEKHENQALAMLQELKTQDLRQ